MKKILTSSLYFILTATFFAVSSSYSLDAAACAPSCGSTTAPNPTPQTGSDKYSNAAAGLGATVGVDALMEVAKEDTETGQVLMVGVAAAGWAACEYSSGTKQEMGCQTAIYAGIQAVALGLSGGKTNDVQCSLNSSAPGCGGTKDCLQNPLQSHCNNQDGDGVNNSRAESESFANKEPCDPLIESCKSNSGLTTKSLSKSSNANSLTSKAKKILSNLDKKGWKLTADKEGVVSPDGKTTSFAQVAQDATAATGNPLGLSKKAYKKNAKKVAALTRKTASRKSNLRSLSRYSSPALGSSSKKRKKRRSRRNVLADFLNKKKDKSPRSTSSIKVLSGGLVVGVKHDSIFRMVRARYQNKRDKNLFNERVNRLLSSE